MARPGREPALPRILEARAATMAAEAVATGPGVSQANLACAEGLEVRSATSASAASTDLMFEAKDVAVKGFENAAASDAEASAAQVAAARAYFLRLARQGAIHAAPIPAPPRAPASVSPAAPAAPLQYSLIDDLTGSQPTVPMPVMEWTLPVPLPVPVRLPDSAPAAAVGVPKS
jgi:hypothetical protein